MNVEEARSRLEKAVRESAEERWQEVEALCTSVISGLPRTAEGRGEGRAEVIRAYELLIEARVNEHRTARALRLFKQYVEDCASPCDDAYNRAYYDGLAVTGTSPAPLRRRMRFYALVQLFRGVLPLTGLVAECGCFQGLSSYLLCRTIKQADPAFEGQGYRIFDSFEGLSAPQAEDAVDDSHPEAEILRLMGAGHFATPLQDVRKALSAFPRIEYFPGWIPEAFPDEPGARYRFVHVDVDLFQPTRDSLVYFYSRLIPGGMIVCDDYGWPGARKAVDDFCAQTGATIRTTPHLQACIVRGVRPQPQSRSNVSGGPP